MFEIKGKYSSAKVYVDDVDEKCVGQIINMLNHPAISWPVAIMPDCHVGKGSVVGFTSGLGRSIIPNVIGVDIGCGMLSTELSLKNIDKLEQLDKNIRKRVPFGFEIRESKHNLAKLSTKEMQRSIAAARKAISEKLNVNKNDLQVPNINENYLIKRAMDTHNDTGKYFNSLGSLGGGNHYIEIGRSKNSGNLWVTIHTGSRNFGLKTCNYWQQKAQKNLKKLRNVDFKEEVRILKTKFSKENLENEIKRARKNLEIDFGTNTKGLESLSGLDAWGYLLDMLHAQAYAQTNRAIIMHEVLQAMTKLYCKFDTLETIESVHNFISFNDLIMRKGAIESYVNNKMIIPYNMEDGIIICEGKSNTEWNFSAPHGAGRVMSRNQAKKNLNLEGARKSMQEKQIFSSVLPLDETAGAYKDPKIIEENIGPTAKIIDRLIPIMNLKA